MGNFKCSLVQYAKCWGAARGTEERKGPKAGKDITFAYKPGMMGSRGQWSA